MTVAPQFPVLVLIPDYGALAQPGLEEVEWSIDEDDFTQVSGWDLKHKPFTSMSIIDVEGHCWRVTGFTKVGIAGQGLMKLFRFIARACIRLRYDYETVSPISFEEVRRRACESIRTHAWVYRDDETSAGETEEPREEQEMLDELIGKARAATDMRSLIGVFQEWLIT